MSHQKDPENPESLLDTQNQMLYKLGVAIVRHNKEHPDKKISPQTIMDITGMSWAQLFTKQGGYADSELEQRPLDLARVALLNFIVKAYPSDTFLMESEEKEKEWLAGNEEERIRVKKAKESDTDEKVIKSNWINPKRLLTYSKWQEIKSVWGIRKVYLDFWDEIYSPIKKKNKELEDAYAEIAEKYYRDAKESIVAHELLFKGDNKNPGDYEAYVKSQNKILKEIEKQLEKKSSLKYKRYFYFSQSNDLPFKENIKDWYKAFGTEASLLTLEHVYRCLVRFPSQCEFKVTTSSSFRHKVTIDDKYMLLEDYAIFDNLIVPESICAIDIRKHNETEKMHELLKDIIKDRKFKKIYKEDIIQGLEGVLTRLNQELVVRKKLRDDTNRRGISTTLYELFIVRLREEIEIFERMTSSINDKKNALTILKNSLT